MDTIDLDRVDRFLDSPGFSESTRRAYASDLADFGGWLERTGRTLEDVSTDFGFSRERIRQIEADAIKKLVTHLRSSGAL